MDELKQCKLQIKAMRKIIEKYSDQINSFEVKSIPQLKSFINPEDKVVQKISEKLKEEFTVKSGKKYAPEFLSTLSFAAFHFVSKFEIIGADLPVSFWFTPSDVLELGAADVFDRAIFLCSLLINLGATAKVHVLEVEGGLRHPVVIANIDKTYLFDAFPPGEYLTGETQKDVLQKFVLSGKTYTRSLFEFSSTSYDEFTEN